MSNQSHTGLNDVELSLEILGNLAELNLLIQIVITAIFDIALLLFSPFSRTVSILIASGTSFLFLPIGLAIYAWRKKGSDPRKAWNVVVLGIRAWSVIITGLLVLSLSLTLWYLFGFLILGIL